MANHQMWYENRMPINCWICAYNKEKEAQELARFIADNAFNMGTDQVAAAVHEYLVEKFPNADGIGLDSIREHIKKHTLHPNVRVSQSLRHLLNLQEQIAGALMVKDEEGNTVIDSKNVNMYLKVTNEIMGIYRSGDLSKHGFSNPDG